MDRVPPHLTTALTDYWWFDIAHHLWGPPIANALTIQRLKTVRFATEQYLFALHSQENAQYIQTFGDFKALATQIKQHQDCEHSRLADLVLGGNVVPIEIGKVYNSIEFVLRIWLLVAVGDAGGIIRAGEERYQWREHEVARPATSIESYVKAVISPTLDRAQGAESDRIFSEYFTLRDLELMGDFTIIWTDNLLQHLRVVKHRNKGFRNTVYIFQHAAILEILSDSLDPGIPHWWKSYAKEALMTMALLLPAHEECRIWFKRAQHRNRKLNKKNFRRDVCSIDPEIGIQWTRYPSRRVANFQYWRQRLLRLEQEFDSVSTWSVTSWWYDRRKGRMWVEFWFQFIGIIFAMVAIAVALASAFVAALQSVEANRYAQEANALASLANEYASNASSADAMAAANTDDANMTTTFTTTFTTMIFAGTTNYISSNVNQNNVDCHYSMSEPTTEYATRELRLAFATDPPIPTSWTLETKSELLASTGHVNTLTNGPTGAGWQVGDQVTKTEDN